VKAARRATGVLIKVQVRASAVRFGDQLVQGAAQRAEPVTQVRARGDEVLLSHGASQTRLTGDPLVWVLRNEPRIIEEDELPESIWRPRGPRRTQPWEGRD
jgi:hypothetical protein